jgi:sulfide:quinone oxidoreductase
VKVTTRIVVLGAGFGGLELTTRIAQACGPDVDLTLIDRSADFVFGFSKLDVMFGRVPSSHVRHSYSELAAPGVRFVHADVTAIDPKSKRVVAGGESIDADVLVVALGAVIDASATPGLEEHGHEFYSVNAAFGAREVIDRFAGGHVVIGVTGTPFKCPPAPSECALLVDEFLTVRGMRGSSTITLVMPFGVPIPPSPEASATLLATFAERGIAWTPGHLVTAVDGTAGRVELDDGSHLPCDLFLGIPHHRAPQVVVEAGMTVDGWIPVDPLTLETTFPDVYAIGDVTSVGTPKAGVFAEGQAAVAAHRIIARVRDEVSDAEYDGHGICYLEFGRGEVAKVDVVFRTGQRPVGDLEGPALALTGDKVSFGAQRIQRWFGRDWRPTG